MNLNIYTCIICNKSHKTIELIFFSFIFLSSFIEHSVRAHFYEQQETCRVSASIFVHPYKHHIVELQVIHDGL